MENNNPINVNNTQSKFDYFDKVEWLNYFNEELIIESINNNINNSLNNNKKIAYSYYDKSNNNINTTKSLSNNYNYNKNKEISKKESLYEKGIYEHKNYFFSNLKEIIGPKKVISFEYEEKITLDNLPINKTGQNKDRDKDKENNPEDDLKSKLYKNVKIIENEKGKLKGKVNLNNKGGEKTDNGGKDDNNILRGRNKSADLRKKSEDENKNINNSAKKKNTKQKNVYGDHKNNKINLRNGFNSELRRYEPFSSYAMRHKMAKNFKINEHFHPNEEKPVFYYNKILLGRTLPEMIVLNDYGLVSDDDYKMYQDIANYNKHNKLKYKNKIKKYHRNYNGNFINNTDINKLNQNENNAIKNKDELIKISYT